MQIAGILETFNDIGVKVNESDRGAYTRFGDGELQLMCKRDTRSCKFFTGMDVELKEAVNIEDPLYLRGMTGEYPIEEGMRPGVFMPFERKKKLKRWQESAIKNLDGKFYNPMLFQYLAVCKPQGMRTVIEWLQEKRAAYVGSASVFDVMRPLGLLGLPVVKVPEFHAYGTIDEWFPHIESLYDKVDVFLFAAGATSKVAIKRIWKSEAPVWCLDIGSLACAWAGRGSRKWIEMSSDVLKKEWGVESVSKGYWSKK